MEHGSTMQTGPLGSTIHVLRADAATVTALAAIDGTGRSRGCVSIPCGASSH